MHSCPFSIVILAAGSSRRLGQAKQLVQVNKQSLLQQTVQNATTLPATEIIVVTGAAADQLPSIQSLNLTGPVPVRLVHNPDWIDGIGSSIAAGVREVSDRSKGVMILLCDQWQIEASDLHTLAMVWFEDCDLVIASKSSQANGPPVIFPLGCFKFLRQLRGDQGARKIVQEHAHLLRLVKIENAAADLDTPADLIKLEEFLNNSQ